MKYTLIILMLMLAMLIVAMLSPAMTMANGISASESSSQGALLVANKGDNTLGIVDPQTGKQVATVAEGGTTGHEVVASPDGKTAYVPIYGNSGVGQPGTDGSNMIVVDIASRKVTGNVDFGHGVRPHCAVIGPKDGMLYVTTELDKAIAVIDPRTLKIVGSIPTGQAESHMLAISPDGKRGYTSNVGPGTVSVLDMENRKTITVIPVSGQVQRIAVSTDGKLVFTSDQKKPQLAVIDTATSKVKAWIPLPAAGYGGATTPDGKWFLLAAPGVNKVAVIDLSAMKVAQSIDVPAAPQEVLVQPDGKVAYVSSTASRKVAMIRTSDWKVEKLIDAGPGVDGLAWAGR
jgi:YVTN family beta-propeller protein